MIEYVAEYHPGNRIADKPFENASLWIIDNEDGTGTEQTIEQDTGVVLSERPIVIEAAAVDDDPLTALRASIETRLSDTSVNSIAKVKAAVIAAFDDAL